MILAQEELLYVNNDLRTILIPSDFILGVQDDRATHRIKFRLPRYYHGIDFNDGYRICIKYENALLEDDEAMIWPDDIEVLETAIFFYWTPTRTAYMSDGWVSFCVTLTHIELNHGEPEESADVLNQFSTAAHRVRVLKGVEIDNVVPEEIEKNIIVQAWEILTIAMERAEAAGVSERNAKESELNAKESELNASASERSANEWELKSEAWAVGKRNDVPVSSDNETYHNNSKYWAEQSRDKTVFGDQTLYDAMNYVYPVGSIYMSTVNMDPSLIFGGSWERIKSKFLLGCEDTGLFVNGNTGGEQNVILLTEHLPVHSHSFTGDINTVSSTALTSNGPSTNTTGGTSLTTSQPKHQSDASIGKTSTGDAGGGTIGNVKGGVEIHYSSSPYTYGGNADNNGSSLSRCEYTSDCRELNGTRIEAFTGYVSGSDPIKETGSAGGHTHDVRVWARRENVWGGEAEMSWDAANDHYSVGGQDEGGQTYTTTANGSHTHNVNIDHRHNMNHRHRMLHYHDITHTHDVANHSHDMNHVHRIDSHTHTLSNHTHTISAHSHTVTPTGTIGNTGGNTAHNNMPPYLCVYMWKRTALAPNWS